MKIALCTIGSRGDIQPFLILGDYLSKQGHTVKVSSAEMYASLAREYAVDYQPFAGDYGSIANDEVLKKEIGANPLTVDKALREKVYPILENSLETFYELCQWADVVLYHPKTMIDGIGADFQEKLIKAYVVPAFTPTRAFTNPILSFLPIPKFLNKLTYHFANLALKSFNTPVKNFRRKQGLQQKTSLLKTPTVYGISPTFLPEPSDYPGNAHFTGFWTDGQKQQPLSEEVKNFVNAKEKVLLITFGSMPYRSNISINTFLDSILTTFNVKIILVRGWGLKEVSIAENKRVLAVDKAPFQSLFPQVDYVLHHGGAGTTAIALQAGVPQFICPVLHPFGDQYFWGKQVGKQGVGVEPIPLKKLKVNTLLSSLKQLMQPQLKENAEQLKVKIKKEDGLSNSLKIVEEHGQ